MTSNSPTSAFGPLRKWVYKDFPNDLRPSKLAHVMAHMGTLIEYSFPILLVLGDGGTLTTVGLTIMLLFHIFITSNIPMGVPLEWNVVMVYGAFFLFGHHAGMPITEIGSPFLIAFLFCAVFLMPLIGNLFPSAVSFLCSMRYYAGNWAYSVWLFKGDSSKRLSECMKTSSPLPIDQLLKFFDEDVVTAINSKIPAFRAMHLHGRALHELLPKAVNNIDDYEYFDGELIAGFALGWNFGDGHLHNMQMLESVQEQCGFEEGELRCIFVESQPLGRPSLAWKIADAKTGLMEEGKTKVRPLLELQPWQTPN